MSLQKFRNFDSIHLHTSVDVEQRIDKLLDTLEKDKALIIRRYFLEECTIREIAKELACTRQRVYYLKAAAVRELMRADRLNKFFKNDFETKSIADLGLTVRTKNGLARAGIRTLGALYAIVTSSPENLSDIKGIGESGLKEIIEKLHKLNKQ